MRLVNRWTASGLLLLLLFTVVVAARPDRPLDDLARLVPARMVAPQLSIPTRYQRCRTSTPPGETIPVTRCPSAGQVMGLAERVARLRRRSTSFAGDTSEAIRTTALIDLLWSDDAGNSLDGAISSLRSALRLAAHPAGAWVDMSATYLVRAERTRNPRDLLEAADFAQQALFLEPRNPAARFNLALALDRFGLDGQAAKAWEQYLMLDSESGWAEEARERVRALSIEARTAPPPSPGASEAEVDAYAIRAPQEARLHGWDDLLGEWGEAVLRGDTARAGARLRRAEAIGRALERRGGDATLADAVRAIRGHAADREVTRRLAAAHREYSAGERAYYEVRYDTAEAHFSRVLEIEPPSLSLQRWAGTLHAAMLVSKGKFEDAEKVLQPMISQTDTLRSLALAARMRWVLATALLRRGRYERTLGLAESAARLQER
ncbi:MAG: hypothetical protein JO040_11335, partial [Gemmatimonadetes bacterium]|nr:hypothetical protein [Gemmatimonadota bacterium]